jgi:hypothetical protein
MKSDHLDIEIRRFASSTSYEDVVGRISSPCPEDDVGVSHKLAPTVQLISEDQSIS